MKPVSIKYTLLVALALIGSIACQDCFTGIKKYWQCKYFYPLMKQSTKGGVFTQDAMINYELVGEQFTLTQNLTLKYPDFASAMAFFQKIYKEMSKNKCFMTKFLDASTAKYSPVFLKKGYLDDAVKIISDFKAQFAPNLVSGNDVAPLWKDWASSQMPTLVDFCLKNDFTGNLYGFYNTNGPDCGLTGDEYNEIFFSCAYPTTVANRKVVTAPSAKLLLQTAQCSVRAAKACSTNVTRFWSFIDWTDHLPKLQVPAGKGKMIAFFDKLLVGDKIPAQMLNFSYMFAAWSNSSVSVRAANKPSQEGGGFVSCASLTNVAMINATNLLVVATWATNAADGTCYLASVSLTTGFSTGDKLTQTFDIKNPAFKDKSYVKDPSKKKNWLYQHVTKLADHNRLEINDFELDALFVFENYRMIAFVDRVELTDASGVFIDGFDSEDIVQDVRRRKRETNDDEDKCRAKCQLRRKRWTGPVLGEEEEEAATANSNGQDWSSFVAERATSSTTRCVTECMNDN